MKTLAERLQWAIDQAGIKKIDLANACGISRGAVSQWFNGRTLSLEGANLTNAAKATGVNPHWLATGTGVRKAEQFQTVISNADDGPELCPSRHVPVVGTAQLGDNGYWSELEHPVGHGDGSVVAWTSDENAYAIRCRGNSMSPRIKDGEFVVVSPKEIPIPGDEVLIRHVDGRVMVKQFLYERDGMIHIISVNESHPPQSFKREEIERFSLVVAILKRSMWIQP